MESGQTYPGDLTDKQWQVMRQLFPPRNRRGRRPIDRRRIVNAILCVVRTGCQWRMLSQDYPNWSTVYGIFWKWRNDGIWQKIHEALREKVRNQSGKKSTPTAAIIDSPSIRTAEGGTERGYDAGKKITGRNRHLAVDTLGLILMVVVHAANCQDQVGAKTVLKKLNEQFCRLKVIFGDCGLWPQWITRLGQRLFRSDSSNRPSTGWRQGVRDSSETLDRGTNFRLACVLPTA